MTNEERRTVACVRREGGRASAPVGRANPMAQNGERTRVLHDSIRARLESQLLCHRALVARSRALCLSASRLQHEARALLNRFHRRSRTSALVRALALQGGSATPKDDGAAATRLVCRVCRQEFQLGDSILFLQTTPTHLSCVYPATRPPSNRADPITGQIIRVPSRDGRTLPVWDHRCGNCGTTWRTLFMTPRCPTCHPRS